MLNLDAERELADPRRADPFAALERRPALADALAALLGGAEVLLRRDGDAAGARGVAWCPTPAALTALVRRGATPPDAPSLEVLRRVNHRAFSSGLGPTLEGARLVTDEGEALATIAAPSPTGTWLLKRPLGFAGRGRALAPPITDAIRRFIAGTLRDEGGVQIEPLHERTLDVSQHGYLDASGRLFVGSPTVQQVTSTGSWAASRRARRGEMTEEETGALSASVDLVAEGLAREGYFGPFGVDAFRYRRGSSVAFQPRCEVNARYSMGWAIGMGDTRPDLVD